MNETDISIEWLNGKEIRGHLAEMAALPNPPNADLKKGFTITRWQKSTAGQSPWPGDRPWEGKDDLTALSDMIYETVSEDTELVWNCTEGTLNTGVEFRASMFISFS